MAPAGGGATLYDLASEWRTQAGDTLGIGRLAGKVRVVAMVYTSCHATCPLIVQDLKRLESSLPPAQRGDVGFVLVSLDPQRDTPGRLAEWAESVQLDTSRWTLLAGDDGSVRELAAALGIRYQEAEDGEIAHGNTISVLDSRGVVVHQRTSIREPVSRLAAVIDGLLR